MAEKRVVIRHPKDGREYGVTEAVFEEVYKSQGFKIISFENGEEYIPPEKKAASTKPAGKD